LNYIGEIAALSAAMFWSVSSFVFTTVSIRIGSIQLNIDRMIMAVVLIFITMVIFNIDRTITNSQIIWLSASGFVGLVIGDTFLFRTFKEIGPRVGMLVMSSNPAIAAFTAFLLLDERISLWGILGIIITLAGVSLVILDPKKMGNKFPITAIGLFYGFIAAAGQGVGLVFAKMAYMDGEIHTFTATFVRIFSAIIILLPLAAVFRRYKNPFKLYAANKPTLGLVFLGSIIGPYLGITLSFVAIIYTQVGIASTLMSTVPILMLPLSVLVYKEKLSLNAVIGAIIAFSGIAVLFLV